MNTFQLLFFLQMLVVSFQNENPGIHLTTPEIISAHGYPAETHTIQTADGYLLSVHRIPSKDLSNRNQPVVFLQHGFVSSSADWVLLGPKKALGFILADGGFDVWMGNNRGNLYSRAHIRLNPEKTEFWNFSLDEIAKYDLPAVTDYIVNATKQQKIIYVGHSLGTAIFFAFLSEHPEYNDRFKAMVAMAPVVLMETIISPMQLLALPVYVSQKLGGGEMFSRNKFMTFSAQHFCGKDDVGKDICRNILFAFTGFDKNQLPEDMLPDIVSHAAAGTSARICLHVIQQMISKRFCRYDYGEKMNLQKYNTSLPPQYNLEDTKVPVAISYADNDYFSNVHDVKFLTARLPNIIDVHKVPHKKFNHIDFVYAKDAPELVYLDIWRVVKQFLMNNPTE